MKKVAMALIFSTLALVGCSYEEGEIVQNGDFIAVKEMGYYDVIQDAETGCMYLESYDSYTLTPYYGEDGEVYGCKDSGKVPD